MSLWKHFFLSGLLLSLIVSITSCDSPVYKNTFHNYSEVLKNRAIERGWIPNFMPISATNIIEEHNLETGFVLVEFSFSCKDSSKLKKSLNLLNQAEIAKVKTKVIGPPWSSIRPEVPLSYYRVEEGMNDKAFLVVDWKSCRAQYFSN